MNPGFIPHEVNSRINALYQSRAQINLEAEAAQAAATDETPNPAHKGLLHTLGNLLNHLMPLPGRVSSSDAMP
jgi:hypothetical protein